jgi:hypothetical protein
MLGTRPVDHNFPLSDGALFGPGCRGYLGTIAGGAEAVRLT